MQGSVVVCLALLALVGADECPDGGRCEAGRTCCRDPAAGGGCCPSDQAQCCEDHVHCCPVKTTCNVATASCVNATVSVPWVERSAADRAGLSKSFRMIGTRAGEEDDTVCPDGSRCPPEFSCLGAFGRFGCCPLPQGVACSDGRHCCPEGHRCSADGRTCIKQGVAPCSDTAAGPGKAEEEHKGADGRISCDDHTSCPQSNTCCYMTSFRRWGCCPLPEAVCCADGENCCPAHYKCDEHNSCVKGEAVIPRYPKLPASVGVQGHPGQIQCPERTTPCRLDRGEWSCCPLQHLETVPQTPLNLPEVRDVKCDDEVSCQDGQTCCRMFATSWGCCPYPNAVCCNDRQHCCPTGYTCTGTGDCTQQPGLYWSNWDQLLVNRKRAAKLETVPQTPLNLPESEPEVGDVKCDDKASCKDGQTCCRMFATTWACCPYPNGVCCTESMHCCPTGYTCTGTGDCTKQPRLYWSNWDQLLVNRKRAAKLETVPQTPLNLPEVRDVKCDDEVSCQDGQTCCRTSDTSWGCCPYPNAVCCSDGLHCCPTGYTCTGTGDCTQQPGLYWSNWDQLLVNRKRAAKLETVPQTPLNLPESEVGDVKCDDKASCKDGQTCCRMFATTWACCPYPNGVCCTESMHCCPTGYTCTGTGDCTKQPGLYWSNWDQLLVNRKRAAKLETVPQTPLNLPEVRDVKCDDEVSCQDGQTCCRTSDTSWGCCPYPNAVCCSDGLHCCPTGYTCTGTGDCTQQPGLYWSNWDQLLVNRKRAAKLETVPQTPLNLPESEPEVGDVKCDDKASCKDGQTCCRMFATTWACCPYPNGVCCTESMHCCPTGYTCTGTGDCTKQPGLYWSNWDQLLVNRKRAAKLETVPQTPLNLPEVRDVKCDDEVSCKDGQTCCRTSDTSWGCCPYPNAVCCSDGLNCCPTGYTCTGTGDCTQQPGLYWSNWDQLLVNRKRAAKLETVPQMPLNLPESEPEVGDVKCDDKASCKDGQTCCRMFATTWACCPYPNGVCCTESMHCCPTGYTCTGAGDCTKQPGLYWSNWDQLLVNRKRAAKLETVPQTPLNLPEVRDVKCDDEVSCQDGQTCCRTSDTSWGCCPYPNAVCCSDGLHCCPTGYTCTGTGDCTQQPGLYWSNWDQVLVNRKRAAKV